MSANRSDPPVTDRIARYGGKGSEAYRYFANDFMDHRVLHWTSVFLQCKPIVQREDVRTVLEFGGGRDVTRALSRHMGIDHRSVDASDRFYPDYVSSIIDFPFDGTQYDLVCSFECLEHNPFEELDRLVPHMLKFTRRYLYVSLPYSGAWLSLHLNLRLPRLNLGLTKYLTLDFLGGRRIDPRPFYKLPRKQRYAEHWWEVGRPGFGKKRIIRKFESFGLKLVSCAHNPYFPHHLFLLFEKKTSQAEGWHGPCWHGREAPGSAAEAR